MERRERKGCLKERKKGREGKLEREMGRRKKRMGRWERERKNGKEGGGKFGERK